MNDDKVVKEVAEKLCECSCHLERGSNRACFYCANAHNFEGRVAPKSQFADWRDANDKLYKTWPEAAQAWADYLCVSLTRELQAIREAAEEDIDFKASEIAEEILSESYKVAAKMGNPREPAWIGTAKIKEIIVSNLRAALEGK